MGSWDFFLGKGIVGGVITSGYNQGVIAGKLALRVLAGEKANSIPFESNIGKDGIVLDFNQMQHFSLKDPETFSHVRYINKPDNFFIKYKTSIFISIVFCCILIIMFLFKELKRREKERVAKELKILINHEIEMGVLQKEAQIDPLTGLLNRLTLENKFFDMLQRIKTGEKGFCLLMIDIDFFKNINDTYGHIFGDSVLKELAERFKRFFRKSDFVFRYGGEEFVIILPDISIEEALYSTHKFRKFIFHNIFKIDEKEISITISIGLSMSREEDMSIEDVVARADKALYVAKNGGRNRVEIV